MPDLLSFTGSDCAKILVDSMTAAISEVVANFIRIRLSLKNTHEKEICMKLKHHIVATLLILSATAAHSQQSSQRIGNQTYFSNGTSAQQIGNQTYFSNGTTAQQIGNQTYFSNGVSAQQIGNQTYFSNGVSAQQIGNQTYFSNGKSCQQIGNQNFCN